MATKYYWQTEDPLVFLIGGEEIHLSKMGVESARRVSRIAAWLGKYGEIAIKKWRESGTSLLDQEFNVEAIPVLVSALLPVLSENALLEAASAITGKSIEFVSKNFQSSWMVDALVSIIRLDDEVRFFVDSYARRFSGVRPQESSPSNETTSSTPSEPPTDGQTTTS